MKITIILLLSTIVILFVKNIQGYNIRILRLPSTDRLKLLTNKECLFIQLDPATQLDIAYQYKKQNPKTNARKAADVNEFIFGERTKRKTSCIS